MDLSVGSRVRVGWDNDSYEEGLVTGTVTGWRDSPQRSVPDCVVQLDAPLTTVFNADGDRTSGSWLLMTTRYAEQTWVAQEGTVHAYLCDTTPMDANGSAAPGPRIASHGVYRLIDH